MSYIELVLLAVALAMDAAAVSMTNGLKNPKMHLTKILFIAGMFGIFQAVMPIIGYFVGDLFEDFITSIDHWLALILLGFLGTKMIIEAVKEKRNDNRNDDNSQIEGHTVSIKEIFLQAIATSIDALAVGIGFVALKVDIWSSVALIGVITFAISLASVFIGKKFGSILKEKAAIFGGIILIAIGLKIFITDMIV